MNIQRLDIIIVSVFKLSGEGFMWNVTNPEKYWPSFSLQADEDQSGSLEYEEFMQIVTGKKSSSTSDKR